MSGWQVSYRRRYRKAWIGYVGQVIERYGSFVDRFIGEAPSDRIIYSTWRPTERGIRHYIARKLWRLTRPNPERWQW